jgi:hypothetical protein
MKIFGGSDAILPPKVLIGSDRFCKVRTLLGDEHLQCLTDNTRFADPRTSRVIRSSGPALHDPGRKLPDAQAAHGPTTNSLSGLRPDGAIGLALGNGWRSWSACRWRLPAASTMARVGGAGLLARGIACWFARGVTQSRATRGLVAAMLLYKVAAVAVPRFRQHRLWTARRGVVGGGGSPLGDSDDRLVCHMPRRSPQM